MNGSVTVRDRIRGSLIGGAVGDALGYTVEFMDENRIALKYGEGGIMRAAPLALRFRTGENFKGDIELCDA